MAVRESPSEMIPEDAEEQTASCFMFGIRNGRDGTYLGTACTRNDYDSVLKPLHRHPLSWVRDTA